MKKKILFVTSTRADFGKLKSLITATKSKNSYKVYIVVTGMHMLREYGFTSSEVTKSFKSNIIKFNNQDTGDKLEIILNKTVEKAVSELNGQEFAGRALKINEAHQR